MSENKSGIEPVEYKVLIKPDEVETKTAGGIYIPDSVKDKAKYAKDEGIVIAIGSNAFTDPDWDVKPAVGQRVLYDRYAGSNVKSRADGEDYRLINDKEIGAIINE